MEKYINDEQFERAYRSAGLWFVGEYMELFLSRINELRDDVSKNKIIEELYNDGNGFDKKISGTRTRVNSLLRIIESGRVEDALKVVISSPKIQGDYENVFIKSKELLRKIENREIKIIL